MGKASSADKSVSISAGNHRAAVLAARNKLVEEHIDLVRPIAEVIARSLPSSFDLDDLMSEGNLGLISAAIRFREGRAPFRAYAKQRIRGAILDSIRRGNYRESQHSRIDADLFAGPANIETTVDRSRLRIKISQVITVLPERSRQIIELYYGDRELKLSEIADILGVHEVHAHRLKAQALRELRPILRRAFLDRAA